MKLKSTEEIVVDQKKVVVTGTLLRTARLRSEYFVSIDDADSFVKNLRRAGVKAHLFTFVQDISDRKPNYAFRQELDQMGVLQIGSYEAWWKKLKDKTRNMVRKAQKAGVEIRVIELNDELVRAIKDIYDETPVRRGKANTHYQKDLETIRREHSSFLERSQFIAAFFQGEIIGFSKATFLDKSAVIMNIIAKISHRDKAPTNALLAKWVEICAQRNIGYLGYGVWGGGGLRAFKEAHLFECFEVPRFFVPLNTFGRLALSVGMHRSLKSRIPRKVIDMATSILARWKTSKLGTRSETTGKNERVFSVGKPS
jgi:hypothetical protein